MDSSGLRHRVADAEGSSSDKGPTVSASSSKSVATPSLPSGVNKRESRLADEKEIDELIRGVPNQQAADSLTTFEKVYTEECRKGKVSPETKFNLAWALVRSSERNRISDGVSMMQVLLDEKFSDRDCLFYIALGEFRLDELAASRKHLAQLLEISPNCREAISLLDMVDGKIVRDGIIGVGIVGAVVAAVLSVVFGVVFKSSEHH